MSREYFFITSYIRSGSNWLRNCVDFAADVEISGEIYPQLNIKLIEKMRPGDLVSAERLINSGAYRAAVRSAICELMKGNFSYIIENPTLVGDKSAYGLRKNSLFKPNDHIAKIAEYFPDSKQILLIRDLRDVIVSYSKWRSGKNLLSLNPFLFLRFILFVWQWCLMNRRWFQDCSDNKQCIIITFEDMKVDFDATIKKIYNHLNIVINDSELIQLKEKLYDINSPFYQIRNVQRGYNFYRKGKIGEWKKEFRWYHRVAIKLIAKQTLKMLGYK